MRRITGVLVVVACIWPLTSGVAYGSSTTNTAAAGARADFNGDGFADLAVGVPFEDVGGIRSAGAVNVLYGSGGKLTGGGSQLFHQNSPGVPGAADVDDSFGNALATGDFNGDGFADLAVGVPGEDDVGLVNVLYGSADKLTGVGSQLFHQNSPGVRGAPEDGDGFGAQLAAGDFNGDGFADLAVGVPFEDGRRFNDGVVNVLYGSAGKLTGAGSQSFSQNSEGVPGARERGDTFGSTLAAGDFNGDGFADLAIGVPRESIGQILAAGAVNVLYGSADRLTGVGSQMLSQDSPGVRGTVELSDQFGWGLAADDFNGDGFADLAIGAYAETVSDIIAAGAVDVLYGSADRLTGVGSQLFNQDSPGVRGGAELADNFGWALAAGDFNGDGFADLAIGVPIETVGTVEEAGAVNVLYGSAGRLTGVGSQLFNQDSPGVRGGAELGDNFGFALAAGDFNGDGFADLAVGVPREGVGGVPSAGAVNVLYGSAGKLTGVGSQLFNQDSPGVRGGAEISDHFGEALAATAR